MKMKIYQKNFKLPPTRGDLETFVKMSTTPVLNLMKESHHSEHKFSKVGIISQKNVFLPLKLHYLIGFNGQNRAENQDEGTLKRRIVSIIFSQKSAKFSNQLQMNCSSSMCQCVHIIYMRCFEEP